MVWLDIEYSFRCNLTTSDTSAYIRQPNEYENADKSGYNAVKRTCGT